MTKIQNSKRSYIGIDLGGSKIEGILWREGKVLRVKKIETPKRKTRFLENLTEMIRELSAGVSVSGIGIGSAGVLNIKTGKILFGPNTKILNNFDLAKHLRRIFKKPVRIDNDTKCFLRAEHLFGQGRGKQNLVGLTLGTGVGGAAMIGGKIIRGSKTSAFELGHMVIASPGLTVENLISSHGFRRLGAEPIESQRRAKLGKSKAVAVYQKIGAYLGIALANLINIFEPEMIIVGGGISKAGGLLLVPAKKEMKKYVIRSIKKLPPVKISKLKHAGALGAVSLFL